MKSILLYIASDRAMHARLQVALDLARATNGHITCLQAVSYEVFAPGDFYGSAMAAAMPVIKEAAEKLRAEIEGELAKEDVSWDWRFVYGAAENRLLEQASLHDIILIGPHEVGEDSRAPSSMVGELTLKAPIPVLVVPADTGKLDVSAPMLVGWNGSAEACMALRLAVPLLKMASKVYLATVEEKRGEDRFDFPPLEGAQYLSRHGIEAEIVEIPHGDARISDTLFSAAQMRNCSLVVMGAYGHSRLAQMLFGGVTRHSLTDPHMPIFMAH
jgi:nucleotide-binding universal stress UspA family protein